jgi:hypothetical protein
VAQVAQLAQHYLAITVHSLPLGMASAALLRAVLGTNAAPWWSPAALVTAALDLI